MGPRSALLLLVLVMCYAVAMVGGYNVFEEERHEGGGGDRGDNKGMFLLQEMKHVVKTDAGDMKVVKGAFGGRIMENPMHVGFINMEPQSLFIPQYLDSNLILFIRRGEAKIGTIHKDELVEKQLKCGDVYRVAAGSAFYLVNTAEDQKLHIICSIDKSESMGWGTLQSFSIGGGTYPTSILAGFESTTLATAFNVSTSELKDFMTRQQSGPIVYLSDSHRPSVWKHFLQLNHHDRKQRIQRMVLFQEQSTGEEEEPTWSLRKLLKSVIGNELSGEDNHHHHKRSDSYNLYNHKADFKNDYGCSVAIDESDYSPLGHSDLGLYLVNLTAGSMMAPHLNPMAIEYGVVLRGTGRIQIVSPNGTLAMNAEVSEGDVFWVPRFYPFCQIASETGPFEFFGFTTSSRKNRPQFLVGANSLMQSMRGPELAASFGVSEDRLRKIVDAQRESTILPSASAAQPVRAMWEMLEDMKTETVPELLSRFTDAF